MPHGSPADDAAFNFSPIVPAVLFAVAIALHTAAATLAVVSVAPEDERRFVALRWFSSDHRPLILSVRFLFLRARKGFDCPPPIKHNGQMKTYKQDGYHP